MMGGSTKVTGDPWPGILSPLVPAMTPRHQRCDTASDGHPMLHHGRHTVVKLVHNCYEILVTLEIAFSPPAACITKFLGQNAPQEMALQQSVRKRLVKNIYSD